MEDLISRIRMYLQTPEPSSFQKIITHTLQWENEKAKQVTFHYIYEHLKSWPPSLFSMPTIHRQQKKLLEQLLPPNDDSCEEMLRKSLEYFEEKQLNASFDWLKSAWLLSRNPELAEVIELFDPLLPFYKETDAKYGSYHWEELVISFDHRTLGYLATYLFYKLPSRQVRSRLLQLEGWCDDPRFTPHFLQLVKEKKWSSKSSRVVWTQIFRRIKEIGDIRLLAMQDEIANWRYMWPFEQYLKHQIEKSCERLRTIEPLFLSHTSTSILRDLREQILVLV